MTADNEAYRIYERWIYEAGVLKIRSILDSSVIAEVPGLTFSQAWDVMRAFDRLNRERDKSATRVAYHAMRNALDKLLK